MLELPSTPAETSPAPAAPPRFRLSRQMVRELVQTAVQAVVLYLVLTTLIGRFEIRQVSMEPNFHAGQRVVVTRWERLVAPWLASGVNIAHAADDQPLEPPGLRRGQVVVLAQSPARGPEPLIKRLIALPGDTLDITPSGVLVNGVPLAEPYIHGLATTCQRYCQPVTLARGMYFVMGDNRPESFDSRSFGPVPGKDIVGPVVLRYWPLDKLELYP